MQYMATFDKDLGALTRFDAACEVLALDDLPDSVAAGVSQELKRFMDLLVSSVTP